MTKRFIQYVSLTFLGCTFLGACSRPVAYFQRGTYQLPPLTINAQKPIPVVAPQAATFMNEASTYKTDEPQEVYASVTKLSRPQAVKKHWERANRMSMIESAARTVKESPSSHKMSLLNRLVVKKLNKRITRQLAPQQTKALSNTGFVIGGAVLLIGGLILLIAGTGTAAFIGLIVGLVGALGLILGLIGI